ncbi:hypothetical protein Fcan01_26728 [Folsomia candida]|uniref:Uncharacterized protein n=1 Tax=Folsomia candida TaxID=158441 RepID=A0A226D190_FOLCA|nr:hypothetical protein Fcan01_26728 [Folsomia candida]
MSDNLKAFVLFEFEVDEGVEGFSSYQSDPFSLPQEGWTNYGILYVGTHDTYDKAVKKLEKYIKNKPIDSSDCDIPRRRQESNSQLKRLSLKHTSILIFIFIGNSTVPIAIPSTEEVSSETPQIASLSRKGGSSLAKDVGYDTVRPSASRDTPSATSCVVLGAEAVERLPLTGSWTAGRHCTTSRCKAKG